MTRSINWYGHPDFCPRGMVNVTGRRRLLKRVGLWVWFVVGMAAGLFIGSAL